MLNRWMNRAALLCGTLVLAGVTFAPAADSAKPSEENTTRTAAATSKATASDDTAATPADATDEPGVSAARERARLMHELYSASLHMMHERYFHGDKAMVPARALEDVFADIRRQSKTEARWIAVNMKAMNIDHLPESRFEKRAAREIAAGKDAVEVVEDGFYRRAGAIPLTSGCVSCHGGFFRTPSKKPKFAGLVISVPLSTETDNQPADGKPEQD